MAPPDSPGIPTAKTRLFGLLGHPVSHSRSPAMQNAAFRAAGIDAVYLAFDVPPEALEQGMAGARALGAGGLNVTVPHKERALELADEADAVASLSGAANTLVPVRGGWKACNTDGEGLLRAVREDLAFLPAGRRCLILGAGGAARGAAVALLGGGAQEILLTNRNESRARRLAEELTDRLPGAPLHAVGLDRALRSLGAGDLLVSATPLGLDPSGAWPWALDAMPRGMLLFDMAYRGGGETSLVRTARRAGFEAASGQSMLLHQGALAFSLWTGQDAPVEAMRTALRS